MIATHEAFWKKHPGLVWSNPNAGDTVRIRAALLRPRFERLLDIALEFGLNRLREEWNQLSTEQTAETERAHHSVMRILSNIETGFSRAATRN